MVLPIARSSPEEKFVDEFSMYQWLVLGLLVLIAIPGWVAVLAMDRNLEDVTRRIEAALREIQKPLRQIDVGVEDIRQIIAANNDIRRMG